ncbi:MAG: DUF3047 domain-containing protein [Verrucomicrobia bacterium]|nr:DUF3047 domain-containing protein [Deltaproteobacteria bacterium]
MKALLFLILLLVCTHAEASDNEFHLGRFSANDLTGWKEQTIGLLKPKTTYTLFRDNDKNVLAARSTKSASGQIYSVKLDPKEYSTLKWSWKIDHTIRKSDEKSKDGDDFSVRVYVLFPRGFFAKTRAICYVWANKLPKGEHVASPFTPNIITVAVDSGGELAGRWTFHQRNVHEDYRRFFGEEPPRIGAVALMTDTDNSGESAVGYYGDISLVRSTKAFDGKQKDHKVKEILQKEPRLKDQPTKAIKNNGDPSLPPPVIPQPVKATDEPKHREPDSKEQPPGITTPAAAPQSPLQQ